MIARSAPRASRSRLRDSRQVPGSPVAKERDDSAVVVVLARVQRSVCPSRARIGAVNRRELREIRSRAGDVQNQHVRQGTGRSRGAWACEALARVAPFTNAAMSPASICPVFVRDSGTLCLTRDRVGPAIHGLTQRIDPFVEVSAQTAMSAHLRTSGSGDETTGNPAAAYSRSLMGFTDSVRSVIRKGTIAA